MCLEKCFVNNWCLCLNDKPFCALWSLIPRLVLDPRKPFSSPSIVIIRKCTFQAFRPKIRTQDLSQFIPKPIIVKIRYTFQRFQSFPRGIGTVKLRHYERATKFEKNLPPFLTKQLFSLSGVKTSGRFFQIFMAFSEKLDFSKQQSRAKTA